MTNSPMPPAESGALMQRTYGEALALTQEVRDYIAGPAAADKGLLDADAKLVASCEEMRVTARVTEVMAWLMVQRAVHAGEISRAEAARPDRRLGGAETCQAEPMLSLDELPPRLADLMVRSRALYDRIARLDAMLDGSGAQ